MSVPSVTMDEQIERCSTITGGIQDKAGTKVTYRLLGTRLRWMVTFVLALLSVTMTVAYVVWLAYSAKNAWGQLEDIDQHGMAVTAAKIGIMVFVDAIRVLLVLTMAIATVIACKPVLPRYTKESRAALLITFVPRSEDINVLEKTLIAAKKVRHNGVLEIIVLDEGDPDNPYAVIEVIERLNREYEGNLVRRISRFGLDRYHQKSGRFETKTKHGNINAGLHHIKVNPEVYGQYAFILGLDPDHAPMESFAERMLGYFVDPNVAYVAGPQAYANSEHNWVARMAESMQFVFHSVIQLAANAYHAPMLVGTSYAVRWMVLEQIGGIQSSITEDMATSYAILPKINPATGKPWKGVYTPDLLAHGEGPASWGDFYKQQDRWSRGTIEYVLAGPFFWRMVCMWRRPLRIPHYMLLVSFYPVTAIIWLLTALNSLLYAVYGIDGAIVSPNAWVAFYGWTAMVQMSMYVWARQYNVTPYERSYSWGMAGMFMSVITAPVFAAALIKTLFRRPVGFNVTPKGKKATGDTWFTFRLNLGWSMFYAVIAAVIIYKGQAAVSTLLWPALAIVLAASPIILWRVELHDARIRFMERRRGNAGAERAPLVESGVRDSDYVPAGSGRRPVCASGLGNLPDQHDGLQGPHGQVGRGRAAQGSACQCDPQRGSADRRCTAHRRVWKRSQAVRGGDVQDPAVQPADE